MAYRFISPDYSFINFSDNHLSADDWQEGSCPGSEKGFCLPILANTDLAFQFIIEGDNSTQGDTICDIDLADVRFGIRAGSPVETLSTADFNALGYIINGLDLGLQKYRLNDTQVLFYVPGPIANMVHEAMGGCFQLAFKFPTIFTSAQVSNCLTANAEDCYTTELTYYSESDEAGFMYCISDDIVNKVRLPMFFRKPTYSAESAIYKQSSGEITLIKAKVGKQYECLTDTMPEWCHDAMNAALIHDTKEVVSAKYSGGISLSGNYEPDWQEFLNYPLGQVKFKVDVTPFLIKKNNCGACEDDTASTPAINHSFSFDGCTTYNIPFSDFSTACCGPLSGTVQSVNAAVATSVTVTPGFVNITIKPHPATGITGIPTTAAVILFHCPNGTEAESVTFIGTYSGSDGC
jgi:hypothetical protein